MRTLSLVRTLARVWRWEGAPAVWARIADRLDERRRLRSQEPLPPGASWSSWSGWPPPPVLNLAPLPPVPRRGGSQLQLLARLEAESHRRGVALLYQDGARWRLEWWEGTRRAQLELTDVAGAVGAAVRAASASETSVVHLESVGEIPAGVVPELDGRGLGVVLGVHDFALFCRRPHLLERPDERFCGFCADLERCARCLGVDGSGTAAGQAAHRRAGATALTSASVVVYTSHYMRERFSELFPADPRRCERVIAPASGAAAPPWAAATRAGAPVVAFVGGVKPEKGGRLLPPLWEILRTDVPGVQGVVLGGGDPELLRRLRRCPGLELTGYYRESTLPGRLADAGARAAVLPSVVPESYSLAVDECLAAGVPVAAFDHGAVADRLRAWGGGRLVPLEAGARGLAVAVGELLGGGDEVPAGVRAKLPTPHTAADAMLALYTAELA